MRTAILCLPLAAFAAAQDKTDKSETIAEKVAATVARGVDEKIASHLDRAMQQVKRSTWNGGSSYGRGSSALYRGDWDAAAKAFEDAAKKKDSRSEGAMYWRAWALHKGGKKDEALAALAELNRQYPGGRWAGDAKALDVEVRQSSGQPVPPEALAAEEIKIYALNGLVNTDPGRALPMLEKIVRGSGSPRMRERALFVLAQIHAPEAQAALGRVARGQDANPDLQLAAVRYLGQSRDKEVVDVLNEVYNGTSDPAIKRQILSALSRHKQKDRLMELAKSEKDPDLRRAAVEELARTNDAKALIELARAEKDSKVKRDIVRELSRMKSKEAADYLLEVLNQ